jgi:hypothetical protein
LWAAIGAVACLAVALVVSFAAGYDNLAAGKPARPDLDDWVKSVKDKTDRRAKKVVTAR